MFTAKLFKFLTSFLKPEHSIHAEPVEPSIRRVVMVHGIFENGIAFDSLRQRLESHGVECFVPQLQPANGSAGLDQLAKNLKQDIDAYFGAEAPFGLVAFSMGGLVSRHYLQALGGAAHCAKFITISSPHRGTWAAFLLPLLGIRQMRPKSDFLKQLEATEDALATMPIISFRTPLDLIILPPTSSNWERAENFSIPVTLHPLMLHSRRVLNAVERELIPAQASSEES